MARPEIVVPAEVILSKLALVYTSNSELNGMLLLKITVERLWSVFHCAATSRRFTQTLRKLYEDVILMLFVK